jgi:23S rRNA (guanine745-N1)-methyltransferase
VLGIVFITFLLLVTKKRFNSMINLLCTVRECRKVLQKLEKTFVCPSGHNFDISRSGYVNLLGPQDRRSLKPGDNQQIVNARYRLLMSGQDDCVVREIAETIKNFTFANQPKILDVGCGEGFYLNQVMNTLFSVKASGLDISLAGIDLAARRYKEVTWVIANADRFLPYPDGEFDVIMSITARKNPSEFSRVLSQEGYLLIVVPAPEDLIELREVLMGEGVLQDRAEKTLDIFAKDFVFLHSNIVTYQERVSKDLLADLLLTTYRGARYREQERFGQANEMTVTFSRQIFCFRPK